MDYDRKSTSSFYGARKSSGDALNQDYAQVPGQAMRGRDDASSFFQPDRNSVDYLNSGPQRSAGYNKSSFYPGGREEPVRGGDEEDVGGADAWDVYADFNNAGPKYSNNYSLGQPQTQGGYVIRQVVFKSYLTNLFQLQQAASDTTNAHRTFDDSFRQSRNGHCSRVGRGMG